MSIPIACEVRDQDDRITGVRLERQGDKVAVTMAWDGGDRAKFFLSVEAVRMMLDGFTPNSEGDVTLEDESPDGERES